MFDTSKVDEVIERMADCICGDDCKLSEYHTNAGIATALAEPIRARAEINDNYKNYQQGKKITNPMEAVIQDTKDIIEILNLSKRILSDKAYLKIRKIIECDVHCVIDEKMNDHSGAIGNQKLSR